VRKSPFWRPRSRSSVRRRPMLYALAPLVEGGQFALTAADYLPTDGDERGLVLRGEHGAVEQVYVALDRMGVTFTGQRAGCWPPGLKTATPPWRGHSYRRAFALSHQVIDLVLEHGQPSPEKAAGLIVDFFDAGDAERSGRSPPRSDIRGMAHGPHRELGH
jgi:hypothetical protein